MRARVVAAMLLLGAAGTAAGVACNPLFGIVSRTDGPTWCEEEAQASYGLATEDYCNDFDREYARATMQETAQTYHGTSEVTDAAANSLPNSLFVSTIAGWDSGALPGKLVNFGAPSASGLLTFQCRVDLLPSELGTASRGGSVGVVAVGGETVTRKGARGTAFVFLSFGPGGDAVLQAATIDQVGAGPRFFGHACPAKGFGDVPADASWRTLTIGMIPMPPGDAGSRFKDLCPVGGFLPGEDAGDFDAGRPEGGVVRGATHYVVLVQLGAFSYAVDYVVEGYMFVAQPFFGYGLALGGEVHAASLHLDNAACTVAGAPDGGP